MLRACTVRTETGSKPSLRCGGVRPHPIRIRPSRQGGSSPSRENCNSTEREHVILRARNERNTLPALTHTMLVACAGVSPGPAGRRGHRKDALAAQVCCAGRQKRRKQFSLPLQRPLPASFHQIDANVAAMHRRRRRPGRNKLQPIITTLCYRSEPNIGLGVLVSVTPC